MKKTKALLCILLALLLGLTLCSCALLQQGETSSQPEEENPVSPAEDERINPCRIAFIYCDSSAAGEEARTAFLNRLLEYGYGREQVQVNEVGPIQLGDLQTQAGAVCKRLVDSGTNLLVAVGPDAARLATEAAGGTETPVICTGVPDISTLLASNVTGLSGSVPVSSVISLALQSDAELKTMGLLYDPEDTGSVPNVEAARAYCQSQNIPLEERAVSQAADVQTAMLELCEKADAVFTPNVSGVLMQTAAEAGQIALAAGTPWYVLREDWVCNGGALAGIDLDYIRLGMKTADLAARFVEGQPFSELAPGAFEDYRTSVNAVSSSVLGITFPEESIANAAFYYNNVAPEPTPTPEPSPEASPAAE